MNQKHLYFFKSSIPLARVVSKATFPLLFVTSEVSVLTSHTTYLLFIFHGGNSEEREIKWVTVVELETSFLCHEKYI